MTIAREVTHRGGDSSTRKQLWVRTIVNMNQHLSKHNGQSEPPPKPRTGTIGRLMSVIFAIAVYLALLRSPASTIEILATVLGIMLVIPWLLAPLRIKRTHWSSPHPRIEAIDLLTAQDVDDFAEGARELGLAMADLGFRHLGDFRLTQQVAGAEALASLFANEIEKQTARSVRSMGRAGSLQKSTTMLLFTTDFTDGSKLVTGNNVSPSLFPRVRVRECSLSFPAIRGPRRLYEIHRRCLAQLCDDAIRQLPSITNPAEYLLESIHREQARHAEAGYHYLDEEQDVYRATWKGACFMAWKLLWPVKPIGETIRRSARSAAAQRARLE